MVAYDVDTSIILIQQFKNRGATVLLEAWKIIFDKLHKARSKPNTWILDNECSKKPKDTIHNNIEKHQLLPIYCHQANNAERNIQTSKAYFKLGLAFLDPYFPVRYWDKLLPQAISTLLLLCSTRVNTRLSAQDFLFGAFNYNKTPLLPPWIKVLAHSKPDVQASWDLNGIIRYIIEPKSEHYCCLMCYSPKQD